MISEHSSLHICLALQVVLIWCVLLASSRAFGNTKRVSHQVIATGGMIFGLAGPFRYGPG